MTLRTATSGLMYSSWFSPFSLDFCSGAYNARSGTLVSYVGNRLNHIERLDQGGRDDRLLPGADNHCCDGFPNDGTVKNLGRDRRGRYRFRYTEGPRDKVFMEKKDREYLTALKDSDDPAMQALFEEEFATLDLSLEHHCNLKREFEPFTRAYREAAGGGGEGGGGEPERRVGKDHKPKVRRWFGGFWDRDTSISREPDKDQATMSALRRQIDQQAAQLRTFQTELEALRTERTEPRTNTAALRRQVTELVEQLRTSQTAIEALQTERAEARTTTAALRERVGELMERLETSQTAHEALRSEHTEARAEVVTLRGQLSEQAERLSAAEAEVERLQGAHSETHAAVEDHARRLAGAETERAAAEQRLSTIAERLETIQADLRSRLEASSRRLDELACSHDSALTTLTRSLETQKRNLLRNIHGLDQRLHRLAGRARHEEHRSHQLHASHERLTASMALAGHLVVPIKHTAIHLGDRLGQGSLMETHRATWQDMPCAYKQLRTPPPTDAAALVFQREVLALARLKHPRVILPYAYTQKPYGLLMPLRVSLSARIQAGALNSDMCYRLAHDMAQGLAYLHSQDQAHGHLKPTNVLLDGEERASLSDFGLSRSNRYTTIEDVAYRAPESLKREPVNDQRSDVYGLGMVLWSMATGKAPFATAHDLATLRLWIASGLKEKWPEALPEAYKAAVEQCWSAPDTRPRAQDLVRTFAELMGSSAEHPRAADAGPTSSPSP